MRVAAARRLRWADGLPLPLLRRAAEKRGLSDSLGLQARIDGGDLSSVPPLSACAKLSVKPSAMQG